MSTTRKDDVSRALAVPFPQEALKWRWADRAQTRKLDYVQGHTVIHRLNDATGNCWNFTIDRIERTEIDAQNAMLMAYVTLEIPELGRRSHIGVQSINARGGEDLVKGAVTDALKKAATLFGVGLELYGPDYEAGEIADTRHTQPNGAGRTEPPRKASTSANTLPNGIPAGDDPPDDPGIVGWTEFWRHVEATGMPRDKRAIEAQMGQSLGADPAYALERFRAWRKDMADQKVLV